MTRKNRIRLLLMLLCVGLAACEGLNFNINSYQVRVDIDPVEGGIISPSSDTVVNEGIELNLQAQSDEAYVFEKWTGDINRTENPVSILVYENYDIVAHFVKKEYELSVQQTGKGQVLERMVAAKTYEHGTIVELTAQPGLGYEFVEWTGDISSTDNPSTIEMDEPKNVTAVFAVKSTSAVLDVEVNWLSFNSLDVVDQSTISDSITHFGLYLDYNNMAESSVKKSIAKADANEPALLTAETSQGGPARLLATAVSNDEGNEKAFFFGVLENIDIALGTQYRWNVEDFTWRKATWRVVDSLANDYEAGEFIRNKNDRDFKMWFLVNTPYQTQPAVNFEDLFVRIDGFASGEGSYKAGFREFFLQAINSDRGTANTEAYSFYPYLVGDKFSLPSNRYLIKEKGSFSVAWQ